MCSKVFFYQPIFPDTSSNRNWELLCLILDSQLFSRVLMLLKLAPRLFPYNKDFTYCVISVHLQIKLCQMKHLENLRLIVKENCIYRSYCFIMMIRAQSPSTQFMLSFLQSQKGKENLHLPVSKYVLWRRKELLKGLITENYLPLYEHELIKFKINIIISGA